MLFISESSCNRGLFLSSERSFPPGFHGFLENVTGIEDVTILRGLYGCVGLKITFSVFMTNFFFVFDKNF